MPNFYEVLLENPPEIGIFVLLTSFFIAMLRHQTKATESLFRINKAMHQEQKEMLAEQRKLETKIKNEHKEEINRYSIMNRGLLDLNKELVEEISDLNLKIVDLESKSTLLRRAIDNVDEMMRATGADVKVISKELERARDEIDTFGRKLQSLPYYKDGDNDQ